MSGIQVLYKKVDGVHFFISNDEKMPGLCVAHADLETAYDAVGITLAKLYKEMHGEEDVFFEPSVSVHTFAILAHSLDNEAERVPAPTASPTASLHSPWALATAI